MGLIMFMKIVFFMSIFKISHAMDHSMSHIDNKITIMRNSDLQDAFSATKNIINKNISGEEILLIFDFDGTLTNKAEPVLKIPVEPRENAIEFVQFAKAHGIHTFVSSAWDIFAETLYRIDKLGLSELFSTAKADPINKSIDIFVGADDGEEYVFSNSMLKINSVISGHLDISTTITGFDKQHSFININYCHLGDVVSAREIEGGNLIPQFYRNKAFSAIIARPDLDYGKIKYVIFVDDSWRNVNFFVADIQRLWRMGVMKFNQQVEIQVFELKSPG